MTKTCCSCARIKSTDSTKFERRACWREAGRKGEWSQRGPRTKRSSSWCCEQYSSSYAHHAFQYISLTFAASSTFIYAVLNCNCNWQLIGSEKFEITKINIFATFFSHRCRRCCSRRFDWILKGVYLPSLSIYYVRTNKDIGKRLPHLYWIRMKICHHPSFIDIAVIMAT